MPLWVSEDSSQMLLEYTILLQEDVLVLREFIFLCNGEWDKEDYHAGCWEMSHLFDMCCVTLIPSERNALGEFR